MNSELQFFFLFFSYYQCDCFYFIIRKVFVTFRIFADWCHCNLCYYCWFIISVLRTCFPLIITVCEIRIFFSMIDTTDIVIIQQMCLLECKVFRSCSSSGTSVTGRDWPSCVRIQHLLCSLCTCSLFVLLCQALISENEKVPA